eukprot:TRINITY_DN4896_c0_g1_i1.p1 TRINITY_DN4896_c0_g1~~TRINITY_DN4896_c0_g1_i1.p1  ORF type:complete len:249 (+),score=35.95 TRINITY_DN4896_c0_g1_i1:60-806(+)
MARRCLALACQLSVVRVVISVAFVGLAIADLLPPASRCADVCSETCSAGSWQKTCCPRGRCSRAPCGDGFVAMRTFRCSETEVPYGLPSTSMHCCVPRCLSNADCQLSEVCRLGDSAEGAVKTCRKPTCSDIGGRCPVWPTNVAPSTRCHGHEVELNFSEPCDSGCEFWHGRCGETCCLAEVAGAAGVPVAERFLGADVACICAITVVILILTLLPPPCTDRTVTSDTETTTLSTQRTALLNSEKDAP